MGHPEKQLAAVLSGLKDSSINFKDICRLLEYLGFKCRQKGSHHIFYKEGIVEILNLQPLGNQAKAYQVRQVRDLVLKYKLGGGLNV